MDKLKITGGRPLEGEVRVSGAKNAALPIMCAALLTEKPLVLTNMPRLRDVGTMAKLLGEMGVQVDRSLDGADACGPEDSPLTLLRGTPVPSDQVRNGPRTGVSGDGGVHPWRFWIAGDPTVSPYRAHVPRRRST